MAVKERKRTIAKSNDNKNILKDYADSSVTVFRDGTGKGKVSLNTTIGSDASNRYESRYESDIVSSTSNMQVGDYYSADSLVRAFHSKMLASGAKKMAFNVVGANNKSYKVVVRQGKDISDKYLQGLNTFLANQERVVLPSQSALTRTDQMGISNTVEKVKNGRMVRSKIDSVIEMNDDTSKLLDDTDNTLFARINSVSAEEVPTFPNNKFGIFARTIGNMAKRNAVTLGCAGAAIGVMATHGTALGTTVLGAVTSGAFWTGLGTLAAGAAPVALAAVGASMLINKVCKEYQRSKAEVEAGC